MRFSIRNASPGFVLSAAVAVLARGGCPGTSCNTFCARTVPGKAMAVKIDRIIIDFHIDPPEFFIFVISFIRHRWEHRRWRWAVLV
jgi:hypothetical protein